MSIRPAAMADPAALSAVFVQYLKGYKGAKTPWQVEHFLSQRLSAAWRRDPAYASLQLASAWLLSEWYVAAARRRSHARALMLAAQACDACSLQLETGCDNHAG